MSFARWNNTLNLGSAIDKIFKSITGRPFYSKSPIFTNYQ